jgi:GT2 family glycosyltransferase
MSAQAPQVSVIVPAPCAERTLELCLAGLRSQSFTEFETIVVEPQTRLGPGAARNLGARRARGDTIVFLDADCRPDRQWLERLIASQDGGRRIAGGAIAGAVVDHRGRPREPGGWFARGVHLCKFAAWVDGGDAGARDQLPTANLCLDRSTWERVGPFADGWCEDTDLSWRARQRGIELHFEPSARVTHYHLPGPARFWRERVERGRAFAGVRQRAGPRSAVHSLLRLAAFPLVAPVMTARALREARRAGQLGDALSVSPVVFAGHLGWSLGEALANARALTARSRARSDGHRRVRP